MAEGGSTSACMRYAFYQPEAVAALVSLEVGCNITANGMRIIHHLWFNEDSISAEECALLIGVPDIAIATFEINGLEYEGLVSLFEANNSDAARWAITDIGRAFQAEIINIWKLLDGAIQMDALGDHPVLTTVAKSH